MFIIVFSDTHFIVKSIVLKQVFWRQMCYKAFSDLQKQEYSGKKFLQNLKIAHDRASSWD